MQSNYCGVFATHQHDIIDPRVGLLTSMKNCSIFRMAVVPCSRPSPASASAGFESAAEEAEDVQNGVAQAAEEDAVAESSWSSREVEGEECFRLQPTFELEVGTSTESMAFQVALDQVCSNAEAPELLLRY
jgi:hypothetical protein